MVRAISSSLIVTMTATAVMSTSTSFASFGAASFVQPLFAWRRGHQPQHYHHHQQQQQQHQQQQHASFVRRHTTHLWYEMPKDPPTASSDHPPNVWTVLANTEQWISQALSSGSNTSSAANLSGENPYTRKEVSYVCETSPESAMVVAGIFRRLREARELGESHGISEEERLLERGEKAYYPSTLRQTQVIVIPASQDMKKFQVFDQLVERINQARRNARDYVTDVALEKLDEKIYGEGEERDWIVSVNCAHLHPNFGEKTPEQVLQELQEEEKSGEVDVNLKAYKERRLLARRSPYPTVVVEVRATPPPDFGKESPKLSTQREVTSADVQRLEALFGKSAHLSHPTRETSHHDDEEAFYDAIGKTMGIDEISLVTPIILAQNWVAEHVPAFDITTAAFTVTDAKHVDEAYEFVFTNVAMQTCKFLDQSRGGNTASSNNVPSKSNPQQFLVMSNFVTSSATSFEKFSKEVTNILNALPSLANKVQVSTLHPEHVQTSKRSPVPICVLEWLDCTNEP